MIVLILGVLIPFWIDVMQLINYRGFFFFNDMKQTFIIIFKFLITVQKSKLYSQVEESIADPKKHVLNPYQLLRIYC